MWGLKKGLRTWGMLLAVVSTGCGSRLDIEAAGGTPSRDSDSAPSVSDATPEAQHVTGQLLARAVLTSTHSVELWETQPGQVLMLQSFKSEAGEQPVDLALLLQDAGSYGQLYRNLVGDPQAPLSEELRAADERRKRLPIRDAALPTPSFALPQQPAQARGTQVQMSTPTLIEPGKSRTLSFDASGKQLATPSDLGFSCPGDYTDGGFCPGWSGGTPGAFYGFVNGSVDETIYWDAVGSNPQAGSTSDASLRNVFRVQQWQDSGWNEIYARSLPPGYSCRATAVGTAATYFGSITGNIVSYGDGFRRSFPSLAQVASHPHWVGNDFGNDIQGLAHDQTTWYLSRTEYSIPGGNPQWGAIGTVALNADLQTHSPPRDQHRASAWTNAGYEHFGDIVVHDGFVFVSLNKANNLGAAVGVFSTANFTPYGVADLDNASHGCAWIAHNPNDNSTYFTDGDATVIHRRRINVASVGKVAAYHRTDVGLVNLEATPKGYLENLAGGKVSSHGKLWVFSQATISTTALTGTNCSRGGCYWTNVTTIRNAGIIYGIDPYSGVVQTRLDITFGDGAEEAEGLDITDETFAGAPGVGGQIHVQTLDNDWPSNDNWNMLNFQVSDLSRL